ncbi:MAG: hypothetical protein WCW02_04390 [Candidatus Buchananbacteria bacterium]
MENKSKLIKIALAAVVVIVVVLALVYYYQQQGIIKIFPTTQERQLSQRLTIDRSKFAPAEGLTNEKFEETIGQLTELKQQITKDLKNQKLWFQFGYLKEFLNDHAGAVAAWEVAYSLQSEDFVVSQNLANVYQYFIKDYAKAEYYYEQALRAKPDYTAAYQGLADLYRFNYKEKSSSFEPTMLKAISKDPLNKVTYYSYLVEFFVGNKDLVLAKKYLAEVVKLDAKVAQSLKENNPELVK